MSTKKLVISSHNIKSNALKNLAKELSTRVGYYVYRVTPNRIRGRTAVQFLQGIDKREQFNAFHRAGVLAPAFSLAATGLDSFTSRKCVARHLTNSCEGKGITIFNKGDVPPEAPLYTEYIPKKKEFRVHIWNNEVIDVSEKRKARGYGNNMDTQIRNTANGYVFCRSEIIEPGDLRSVACAAVSSLDRTYGAVDVIWNERMNKCFVLEVNSRPGLEGTTVKKYADAILKGIQNVG